MNYYYRSTLQDQNAIVSGLLDALKDVISPTEQNKAKADLYAFVTTNLQPYNPPNPSYEPLNPASSSSGLPNDIRESVAIANIKSVGEQPSMLSNLSFANLITNDNLSQENAVANQQAMNQVGLTVTGKAVNRVSNMDPSEGVAINKIDTGNETAAQIAELKASVKAMSDKDSPQ